MQRHSSVRGWRQEAWRAAATSGELRSSSAATCRVRPAVPRVVSVGSLARRARSAVLRAVLGMLLASGSVASAQPPSVLLREAEAAERDADPRRALRLYREVAEADDGGRLARRAERRITFLEERAEGEFAPLSGLLRARNTPGEASLAALAEEVASFPPGRVRRESWQLLGERHLAAGRTAEAIAAYRAWTREPELPEAERRLATTGLARALGNEGRAAEGLQVLEEESLGESRVAEMLAQDERRGQREVVAAAVLAIFALLVLGVGRRGLLDVGAMKRAWRPSRWVAVAYALGVPLLVAAMYDLSSLDTFALLAGLTLPVMAVTALAAESARGKARWLLLSGALASHGAVAYLVLARSGHVLGFAP